MKTKAPAKRTRPGPTKPYWEMTLAELAEATKEFDGPLALSRTRPLSNREREKSESLRGGPAVSVHETPQPGPTGKATKAAAAGKRRASATNGRHQCVVRLDEQLWARATDYARKHQTSLPQMIDRGLRGLLAFGD